MNSSSSQDFRYRPHDLSLQHESLSRTAQKKVIYVHGSGLSNFHFTILTFHSSSDEDFSILEVNYGRLHFFYKYGKTIWRTPFRSGGKHPSQEEGITFSRVLRNQQWTLCETFRKLLVHFSLGQFDFIDRILEDCPIFGGDNTSLSYCASPPSSELLGGISSPWISLLSTDLRDEWATRGLISFCPSPKTPTISSLRSHSNHQRSRWRKPAIPALPPGGPFLVLFSHLRFTFSLTVPGSSALDLSSPRQLVRLLVVSHFISSLFVSFWQVPF